MKNACIVIGSLVLSVISLIYATTAEKRARARAERAFASQRADLERQITERMLAQLAPLTNRVIYTSRGKRSGGSAQPEYGLLYPTLPPKRIE